MNRYSIGLTAIFAIAMCSLSAYVRHLIPGLIDSGRPLTAPMAILIAVAGFWSRFWWGLITLFFFIFAACGYIYEEIASRND